MKILVAMSGGVDSSVVAHLLAREGHELIAVQFQLWMDPLAPPLAQILPSKCCNAATLGRAKKVASDLGIPFQRIDLSSDFKREVVDPFLEGYKSGLTPNPCVGCNRTIKFGKLLEIAEKLGCEKIATGHYARVAREVSSDASSACRMCHAERNEAKRSEDEAHLRGVYPELSRRAQHDTQKYLLLEALDKTKDQSYFLYGLSQEQLSKALFPLGSMTKKEVFALAREFGVPLPAQYQESQDLCFFPEKDPHAFLNRHLPMQQGEIVDTEGRKRGMHRGLPHYTEGQRHGLKIGGLKIPLHVVAKNVSKNRLIVGKRTDALRNTLNAHSLRFVAHIPEQNESHRFDARIHSLGIRHQGTMTHNGAELSFVFDDPVLGISPGQSIVLYRSEEVVGGGVIA